MENPKTVIAERIKESANVLVTVSANPSVDQLAAAIGLTIVLNKLGKHATAVFSGTVPSTIEFLQPEKTLEKDTNSLRDFIIALDKSKADKLRYKVEDKLVKIFITPYRTSITDKDLEFSQGDFNVDLVLALGVHQREELDQAITSHGRILHDATVATLNTQSAGELGSINWVDNKASSLCEMVTGLSEIVKTGMIDGQIATALLTGIVAETDRFSNSKTTSDTMAMSSKLMAAGANQQLVATKLQEPLKLEADKDKKAEEPLVNEKSSKDGSLDIDHEEGASPIDQIHIDEHGTLRLGDDSKKDLPAEPDATPPSEHGDSRTVITSPPKLGGRLTANSIPEPLDPSTDPLSLPQVESPLLSHDTNEVEDEPLKATTSSLPILQPLPEPQNSTYNSPSTPVEDKLPDISTLKPLEPDPTLSQIEDDVKEKEAASSIDEARNAVLQAAVSDPNQPLEPVAALNSNPMDLDLGHDSQYIATPLPSLPQMTDAEVTSDPGLPPGINIAPVAQPNNAGLPTNLVPLDKGLPVDNTAAPSVNASAPPPVPPPMMPPAFGNPVEDDTQTGGISGVAL